MAYPPVSGSGSTMVLSVPRTFSILVVTALSVSQGTAPFGGSPMVDDVAKSLCERINATIDVADASGQNLAAALLNHVVEALHGCVTPL